MSGQFLTLHKVSFSYDTLAGLLLTDVSAGFPLGWTGVVGANGAGKSTLLKLAVGELQPLAGSVRIPGKAVYCPQRTDDPPQGLAELMHSEEADAFRIRFQLGLAPDWRERWNSLSHGERKRAQIAVALFSKPQVLALDEPTNHIDRDARLMLIAALTSYRGVGLLVSHDRELLDTLCSQCLFMEPGEALMRPGNYTRAARQADQDSQSLRKHRQTAQRATRKLKREAAARRSAAARADSQGTKRHLDAKDHDGRARVDLARLTGKDAVAGRLVKQMEARLRRAEAHEQAIKVKKTYELGIWIQGARSPRDFLFKLPADRIALGGQRMLNFPAAAMRPTDHIALTGPNGSGKSTLIRHILGRIDIPPERIISIPQEIDLSLTRHIMDEVHRLGHERLGHVMTVVSCLGSRPAQLLESREPSPGEMRKILLALGISLNPHLIVMDEPTNHMDLPSITCLENALADCPCGLLLVSHDLLFLQRLCDRNWEIAPDASGDSHLRVHA